MLKKLIIAFALLFIPFVSVNAQGKVKVYMFIAGGCPYCEQEEQYLTSLESYNQKFELIKKELYVDHIDWEEGKDYKLGVKVANGFKDAGFEDASYQGTPFVVISDLYAVSGYSTSLESVINEAYEKGDKDIVSCYEKGNTDCLNHLKTGTNTNNNNTKDTTSMMITIICSIGIIFVYLLKSNKDKNDIIEYINNNR